MARSASYASVVGLVDAIASDTVRSGVDAGVVAYARQATLRRFTGERISVVHRRVGPYFDTVVRNRLVRTRTHGAATARMVLASVEADLRQSGRSEQDVWGELERGWAGVFPSELMEEFRARLCA